MSKVFSDGFRRDMFSSIGHLNSHIQSSIGGFVQNPIPIDESSLAEFNNCVDGAIEQLQKVRAKVNTEAKSSNLIDADF